MKYYVKQGIFPFIYLLFMAMIALGIISINGLLWLKILLAILNVGLYAVVVAASAYKDGQTAVKVQAANDLERREIIRTGEDRPLKIHEEYKPWKGFMFGFVACVPLLILLAVHTVVYFATGSYTGIGAIASIVYFMVFVFFRMNVDLSAAEGEEAVAAVAPAWYLYFGTLVALPLIMCITGVAYILGARKIRRQYEEIREKQRQIYGDEF